MSESQRSKAGEMNRKLTKKGGVLIMQQRVDDQEITPAQVLDRIEQLRKSQQQAKQQIMQAEQMIRQAQSDQEQVASLIGLFEPHEEWAWARQSSTAKAVLEAGHEEAVKKAAQDYEADAGTPIDDQRTELWHRYRHFVALSEDSQKRLSNAARQKYFYGKDAIVSLDQNPFADWQPPE